MDNLKDNFKHEQITALGKAVENQDFKAAYQITLKLIAFCEKFQVTEEDLSDLVEAYSIHDSYLKEIDPFNSIDNKSVKILELLLKINKDDEWKIEKYEQIISDLTNLGNIEEVYQAYWELIRLYRMMNKANEIKYTYSRMVAYLNNTVADILNFAEKIDAFDQVEIIEKTKSFRQFINKDPLEKTKKFSDVYPKIENQIHNEIGKPGKMGYVYMFWPKLREKLIIEEKLEWSNPGLLNNARFD